MGSVPPDQIPLIISSSREREREVFLSGREIEVGVEEVKKW